MQHSTVQGPNCRIRILSTILAKLRREPDFTSRLASHDPQGSIMLIAFTADPGYGNGALRCAHNKK